MLLIQTYPLPECCQKERGQQSTTHILHGFLNVGEALPRRPRTHNIQQRFARCPLIPAETAPQPRQQEVLPTSTKQAFLKALYKSLRDTGLVSTQPVNQPHMQFVPDPPQEPTRQPSVQEAVRTNIQTLTGGILQVSEPTVDSSKNSFISSAVPLASRVPERIRNKIWANEFTDFSHLLITYRDDSNYTLQLQSNENGQQVLSMVTNHKQSTIQTIEQWTTAFQIFVSIFTQRFPQDSPALMNMGL